MTRDGSFGGPEWVKACGECDGPPVNADDITITDGDK